MADQIPGFRAAASSDSNCRSVSSSATHNTSSVKASNSTKQTDIDQDYYTLYQFRPVPICARRRSWQAALRALAKVGLGLPLLAQRRLGTTGQCQHDPPVGFS